MARARAAAAADPEEVARVEKAAMDSAEASPAQRMEAEMVEEVE